MDLNDIKVGLHVRTYNKLRSAIGFIVHEKYLDARSPNKRGEILGYIPGHGGDCWWIKHSNSTIGAYCFDEFEPSSPYTKSTL